MKSLPSLMVFTEIKVDGRGRDVSPVVYPIEVPVLLETTVMKGTGTKTATNKQQKHSHESRKEKEKIWGGGFSTSETRCSYDEIFKIKSL